MAILRYGADGANLTINTIPIEEFGDTDPPIVIEDIDSRTVLKRGINESSVRLDSTTRAVRLTINLMPGSDESRQMHALDNARADIIATFRQTGTNETLTMFDGVIDSMGQRTRAGKSSVSDDQWVFVFTNSQQT